MTATNPPCKPGDLIYRHVCDCCGEPADYGDYAAWAHPETCDLPDDWAHVDGADLCTACWDESDESAEFDDPVRAHVTTCPFAKSEGADQ